MLVDAHGQRGLVCKQAPSRIARHQQLNDMVCASSGVGRRPGDQRTSRHFTTRWQTSRRNDANTVALGKAMVWDVTVVSTLAQSYHGPWSYVAAAVRGPGEVAELPAARKCEKYAELSRAYTFLPIAVETLRPMNESAYHFFEDLGRRICDVTGDTREVSFIFQRLSVTIQRFSAALYHEIFVLHDDSEL